MATKLYRLAPIALAFVAAVVAAPVSAQLYKWVDGNGATHYSDRKPDDQKTASKVKSVDGAAVSVYSPDKSLLRAVEVARDRANRPAPVEPDRTPQFYAVPVAPQPLAAYDPCLYTDCGYYYPVAAYPYRRRPALLGQAVLPPGATAGTINSPGIIPGTTGTQFGVPTPAQSMPSRVAPHTPRAPLDPRSFR